MLSYRNLMWVRRRFCSVIKTALAVIVALACLAPSELSAKVKWSKKRPTIRSLSVRKSVPATPFSTVVIDAGHGGFDLGGIRQNIIPEKGVALDVALRLQQSLRIAGLNTAMTRSDDRFVTLDQRVAIANSRRNAIFMCIHFNSALRTGARGIETFYKAPSEEGLASRIQRNVMRTTSGENRGVKRASFYVLSRTKIRAVLVECGFLTNPEDVALASSPNYRQKLADAISAAILDERDSLRAPHDLLGPEQTLSTPTAGVRVNSR